VFSRRKWICGVTWRLTKTALFFLNGLLQNAGPLKIMFAMAIQLINPIKDDSIVMHANSFSRPYLLSFDEDGFYHMVDEMMSALQIFTSGGSGWVVEKLLHLDINVNKYKPIRGRSYIPTPPKFNDNCFLLNINNSRQLLYYLFNTCFY